MGINVYQYICFVVFGQNNRSTFTPVWPEGTKDWFILSVNKCLYVGIVHTFFYNCIIEFWLGMLGTI